MLTKEEIENLSIDDYFHICLTNTIHRADLSDFKDGEIRCLTPKNPVRLIDIEKWDGILSDKEPIIGSYGIDKKRKVYVYLNKGVWKPIKSS